MLITLSSGLYPLGQFDSKDSELTTFLGGEVCTLVKVTYPGTDKGAKDVFDGYSPAAVSGASRPAVSLTLTSGNRPLFLADEGTSGYGTLFGVIVGGTVGQTVTGGTVLGPHTALGSGKITIYNRPGLFGVTLDAVDTTLSSGLVPTNPTLDTGDALYATSAGKLTPTVASAFENIVVGRFVDFSNNGSKVTTPFTLISSANTVNTFTQAVFHFEVET
jgi:hypothetical protein